MRIFKRYTICCLLLLACLYLHAQQGNSFYRTPILKPGDNPAEKLKDAVFYRIEVSKTTVFAGEPILVEYKLYMSVPTEPSPGKEPAFNGCSIIELPNQTEPIIETVNGKKYNVILARKMQLTPLQDGQLILPEASINNVIQYTFADGTYKVRDFSMAAFCKPVAITVKPLPLEGKPANFSGLVGKVSISVKIDSNTVPANDNTHLTLVIKGTGNVGAVNMPSVNWPANTDHFDATDTQHNNTDTFPVTGDKIFSVPFIGTKQGSAVIPPVAFAYFDPADQKYVTTQSDSVRIQFTGPLPKTEQKEIITEDITNRKYLWIVPAIALTVTFVIIITSKRQRNEKKRREAEELKQKLWEEAVRSQQPVVVTPPPVNFSSGLLALEAAWEDHVFFTKAKELLTAALKQKFGLAAAHETGVLAEMQVQQADAIVYENARHIYKICNLCLYSPVIEEGQRMLVMETLMVLIKELGVGS